MRGGQGKEDRKMNFGLIDYAAIKWAIHFPAGGMGTYSAEYSVRFGAIIFQKEKMTWQGGKNGK